VKLPTVQTAELSQYVFDYFLATSPTTCTFPGSFNSPKISHNGKQQTMAASYLYLWLPVHDAVVTASTFAALSLMMCGFSVVGIPTCPMQMLEIVLVLCVCRLLLDANSGSAAVLAVDVMNLLSVLCSSEPVQLIGISSRHVIFCRQFYFSSDDVYPSILDSLNFHVFCY